MGKIDDMRRLREQQFAETDQRRAKSAAKAAVATPVTSESESESEPAPAEPKVVLPAPERKTKGRDAKGDQGKCPDCGKTKPLQNGVMASHQKGFGKACPGSRKAPV